VGPAFTLLGQSSSAYAYVFGQSSGAEQASLGYTEYFYPSDITLGADSTVSLTILSNGAVYLCVLKTIYTSQNCISTALTPGVPVGTPRPFPANIGGFSIFSYGVNVGKVSNSAASSQVWSYPSPYGNVSSPSVSVNSASIFVGTSSGYAISLLFSTGALQWAVSPCPQACSVGPRALAVPSSDGSKVFFPMSRAGGPSGYAGVIAVSASSGATQWTFSTNGDALSLALDVIGLLFVGDSSGSIYAVRSSSGAVVWTSSVGGSVANLAIGANSFLYVATNSSLVALH
jgi:hypothetical protein